MSLDVRSDHGGHIQIAHGDHCVAVMAHDDDGAFVAGLVYTPSQARKLARLLVEQAEAAEQP